MSITLHLVGKKQEVPVGISRDHGTIQGHRIVEKTSKILNSNLQPNSTEPNKPKSGVMLIFSRGKDLAGASEPFLEPRGMDLDPCSPLVLLCRRQMTQGLLSHNGGIITSPRHCGFVTSWESVTGLSQARH